MTGQIDKVDQEADYVGSLVLTMDTVRPTEYEGPKLEPPGVSLLSRQFHARQFPREQRHPPLWPGHAIRPFCHFSEIPSTPRPALRIPPNMAAEVSVSSPQATALTLTNRISNFMNNFLPKKAQNIVSKVLRRITSCAIYR